MSDVLQLVGEVLVVVVVLRLIAGWVRPVRWAPEGDPDLVAVMAAARPRVPSRTACAVIDLSSGRERVRRGFNRCDGQTVFEIGSVTKALTGLLLADAIDRGELALDTTLGQSWPELAGRAAARVTVSDMAHHRSGLPESPLGPTAVPRLLLSAYLGLDPYRGLQLSAVLRIAARARLRQPGTERYSNLGAALAGHTVARSAGRSFADLLAQRITGPLGMTSTSAEPTAPRRSGRGWLGSWAQSWRLDGYAPAGAITSTLDDLIQLARHLRKGTCPGAAALDRGLFWQIHTTPEGHRRIWHNGETGGYSAYLAVYPEARKAVAVLAARADADQQAKLAGSCIRATRQ